MTVLVLVLSLVADQPPECADEPHPFICSRAEPDKGPSLHWPNKTATFRVNNASVPVGLSVQTVVSVVRASFASWQGVDGAEIELSYGGLTTQKKIGFDFKHIDENENIVIFQSDWRHDEGIIGLTTATFNAQSGEIFDADIELNADDYEFSTNDVDVRTDVQNTVTHEIGHFLGFDHTDRDGSTIKPECAATATMSRRAQGGETAKRTVWYTDAEGMRYVYPRARAAQYCSQGETPTTTSGSPPKIEQLSYSLGGCSSAHPSWLAGLGVVLLVALKRRRSGAMLLVSLAAASASAATQPDTCANLTNPKPFVCSHVNGDRTASLHWPTGDVVYKINTTSIPAHLAARKTDMVAAVQSSFGQWTQIDGTDIMLTYGGDTSSQVIGTNYLQLGANENIVLFQADWPHEDRSQDRLVIALTTATFNASTGEIFDADIELNSEYFTFTIDDLDVQTDVRNTVTHEAGHFIGFDHPENDSRIPVECASTATMSARAGNGETAKRSLAPTDMLGARTVYPSGKAPQYCSPEEAGKPPTFEAPAVTQVSSSLGGGCAALGPTPWSLALLAVLARRRRR